MMNVNWKKSTTLRCWMTWTWICDNDEKLLLSIEYIVLIEFARVLLLFKTIFRIFFENDVNFFKNDFIWNVFSYCISSNTLSFEKIFFATCARAILSCDDIEFSSKFEEKKTIRYEISKIQIVQQLSRHAKNLKLFFQWYYLHLLKFFS